MSVLRRVCVLATAALLLGVPTAARAQAVPTFDQILLALQAVNVGLDDL